MKRTHVIVSASSVATHTRTLEAAPCLLTIIEGGSDGLVLQLFNGARYVEAPLAEVRAWLESRNVDGVTSPVTPSEEIH